MLLVRREATLKTLFLLIVIAYCTNIASSEGRVVCYYTNWSVYRPGTAKFNPQNINPYLCTHLVYAFGGFTKDNQMKPFDKYQDIEQGGYAKFTGLKTYNKQLKTMIAIGGWNEASSRFSPLVASAERREQFIKNILKFLRQNHFDGIDLDWEYPAHREGGKSHDRDNYAQFVLELRAEFEREAEKTGRTRLLLTMAVPAGIDYIDKGYNVPKLNMYLDWFNVLTYDFHSSQEPSVNHHAPLYAMDDESEYNYDAELNIDYAIKYYLKAGADRDKLVLGIPTYGRSYTLFNEESSELGSPSEGPGEQGDATREKGYLAYYEICQTLKDDPEWTVVQPNANVMGPYAYRRNQWVGYDDEAIVRKKAEYVVAQGLGGIMFWAIDNDDFRGTCSDKPYPLIEAAKEAMAVAFGLGINEVAKPKSHDNSNIRNRLSIKSEVGLRRPAATWKPAINTTTIKVPTPTIRLTEAEGSSLYIGDRGSTTPAPPSTPDPSSDFKCEDEGFFQHPRECEKYYWCLNSGPSGLGIVAHQFTCPSGLYFNPAADSCDFARNVPCRKKKVTAMPPTTEQPTSSYNRDTVASRISSPTSASTTTIGTTSDPVIVEMVEHEEGNNNQHSSLGKASVSEEDPRVIKELIDLIRKVGGVEQLEKHLLQSKDGSITLNKSAASGAPTTPSTISKSLYDRVLNRPGTLNSFTRNRLNAEKPEITQATGSNDAANFGDNTQTNYLKYSSVLRSNSRQEPQNEGIEKISEFDGFLKERKQYVTINRNRVVMLGEQATEDNSDNKTDERKEYKPNLAQGIKSSYTSLRRSRPITSTPPSFEYIEEIKQPIAIKEQTHIKHYASLSRVGGRTARPSEINTTGVVGASTLVRSPTTNRYKYIDQVRPITSTASVNIGIDFIEDDTVQANKEYEDDSQQKNVNLQKKQANTTIIKSKRKYASIGQKIATTTTATTPKSTDPVTGTETIKASTVPAINTTSKINIRNNVQTNYVQETIPESIHTNPHNPQITQSETNTIINAITQPIRSPTSTTNPQSTTSPIPAPTIVSTIHTPITIIDSFSLANGINDLSKQQFTTTLSPANEQIDAFKPPALNITINNPAQVASTTITTSTMSELAKTESTANSVVDNNNKKHINNVDSEVATKTENKNKSSRRHISTRNRNKSKAEKVNEVRSNVNKIKDLNGVSPTVHSMKITYSSRKPPLRTQDEIELASTSQLLVNPINNNSLVISCPRRFSAHCVNTKIQATTTTSSTVSDNDNTSHADDGTNLATTRVSQLDTHKVSSNNTYELLDTSTNFQQLKTPKYITPIKKHTNNEINVNHAGNGSYILRHDVVSNTSLSTKDEVQDNILRNKYTWRDARLPKRRSKNTFIPLWKIYKKTGRNSSQTDYKNVLGNDFNASTLENHHLQNTSNTFFESKVSRNKATQNTKPNSDEIHTKLNFKTTRITVKENNRPSLLKMNSNNRDISNNQSTSQPMINNDKKTLGMISTSAEPENKNVKGRNGLNGDTNLTNQNIINPVPFGTVLDRTAVLHTNYPSKNVKLVHAKTVQEKPGDYDNIYTDVSEPKLELGTSISSSRNRGSIKFQSNDLSSLLALDFSSRREGSKKSLPLLTMSRKRVLKKPRKTVERLEVKEFMNKSINNAKSVNAETTSRLTLNKSTLAAPIHGRTDDIEKTTRRAEFKQDWQATRRQTINTEPFVMTTVNSKASIRPGIIFKRPLTITSTSTTLTRRASNETTMKFKLTSRNNFFNFLTGSTALRPETNVTIDYLTDLQNKFKSPLNNLHANNEIIEESNSDVKLRLPIYHRRKYYQYVKDSPITYVGKTQASTEYKSDTVNIHQKIHDVFNVSNNATPNNFLEAVKNDDANSVLSPFLLNTPRSV